jgi:hypothetical protein
MRTWVKMQPDDLKLAKDLELLEASLEGDTDRGLCCSQRLWKGIVFDGNKERTKK